MSEQKQPTFLVNAHAEPVSVQVHGKANYLNCNHFREFMETMLRAERAEIHINFAHCKGMDSTFLGILAGTALELKQHNPPGRLSISHLNDHNSELITNLGIQSLFHMEDRSHHVADDPRGRRPHDGKALWKNFSHHVVDDPRGSSTT